MVDNSTADSYVDKAIVYLEATPLLTIGQALETLGLHSKFTDNLQSV